MNDETLYLRRNIQVEPLIDQWYAWSHLIAPATAARNITQRHLKIMDSYISAPQIHASAVANPKMAGGPFMDYGGQRVDEVRALRNQTQVKRANLIQLSESISALDSVLRSKAKGFSLEPLYAEVPEALKGYVELVYDLNNKASFRIIESLMYRSQYYDRSAQSFVLRDITADDRPFILSTPRLLSEDDELHFAVPFGHELVDHIFALKTTPQKWHCILDMFEAAQIPEAFLHPLFTNVSPPDYRSYEGPGVRWRYFGHACILIESQGISILTDPVLSYTYESSISRYTYDDLPSYIDYVLITHNHQDHILFETLLQLRHKIGKIIVPQSGTGHLQDPSIRLILENTGFKEVIELSELDVLKFDNGEITALPFLGEHSDLQINSKLAYLVKIGRHKLLFAADSRNIEPRLYEHLHQEIGDVDALFIGMECDGAPLTWLYGPLLTQSIERRMDESRRLAGSNYEQAINLVERFGCKDVYVYAMGQEPWLNYVMSLKYTDESRPIIESNRLIKECRDRGLTAERLFGEKEILLS